LTTLYEPNAARWVEIREAASWAHLRCGFHDGWGAISSEIARRALDRIGAPNVIERQITVRHSDERQAAQRERSRPRVGAFRTGAEAQLGRCPGMGDLTKFLRYGLARWPSFTLFREDGRVAIDNNATESVIKPVVVRRKHGSSPARTLLVSNSPIP